MTLSSSRRRILGAALLFAALAGAFPPWTLNIPGRAKPAGLHFVLSPPEPWGVWQPRVDGARLVIIWLTIAGLAGVALLIARRPGRERPPFPVIASGSHSALPAPDRPRAAVPETRGFDSPRS